MKSMILSAILIGLPLQAQDEAPQLGEDLRLMQARYAFWFKGDKPSSQEFYESLQTLKPESAWHGADLLIAEGQKKEAQELLISQIKEAYGEAREALVKRLFYMDPYAKLPVINKQDVFLANSYVKDHKEILWSIKEGIPLSIEKDHEGHVISLRVKSIIDKGIVAKTLGFNVGDRIYSVADKDVADWSKFEVPSFFSKALVKGGEIKVVMQPAGSRKKITRVFHIMDDGDFILDVYKKMK